MKELAKRIVKTIGSYDFFIIVEGEKSLKILVFDDYLASLFPVEESGAAYYNDYHVSSEKNFHDFVSYLSDYVFVFNGEIKDLLNYINRNGIVVELHTFPEKLLVEKKLREEVASRYGDPNFFKNLFSSKIFRWREDKFVEVTLGYVE